MTFSHRMATRLGMSAIALFCTPGIALPQQDATAVLKRAAETMGANNLNAIRYSGAGTGFTFGQAYLPGTAWPRVTVHNFDRSIDYEGAAMRDEIVISRAEPRG